MKEDITTMYNITRGQEGGAAHHCPNPELCFTEESAAVDEGITTMYSITRRQKGEAAQH